MKSGLSGRDGSSGEVIVRSVGRVGITRVGSIGSKGSMDASGSADDGGELLLVGIEDFARLRVDEETDNAKTTGILHTTREEVVEGLAHRHTATHLSGEHPYSFGITTHRIDGTCHVVVEGGNATRLVAPWVVGVAREIVALEIGSHVVFDEYILHAERGVVIVETEGGGEGDVVVESVGFGDFGFDIERRFLWLLAESISSILQTHVHLFFAIDDTSGKSREAEKSIVGHFHGLDEVVSLSLVHSDDDEGDSVLLRLAFIL